MLIDGGFAGHNHGNLVSHLVGINAVENAIDLGFEKIGLETF